MAKQSLEDFENTALHLSEPIVEDTDVITGNGFVRVVKTESGKTLMQMGVFFNGMSTPPWMVNNIGEPDYTVWRNAILELQKD